MANLLNNNFHNLRFDINYNDYWDFFINKDPMARILFVRDIADLHKECLSAYIDASNKNCVIGNELISDSEYYWEKAKANAITLYNIGYTGLDNGLIPFERDKVDNKKFLDIFQNSTYAISDDTRLRLHQISGGTKLYDYPLSVEEDKIKLNGGFYQGFFKTSDCRYQILPSELNNGEVWQWEFVLNKVEFEKESTKTLNDKHPDNKGIFFYIGTRAENKWDYLYNAQNEEDMLFVDEYVDDETDGLKCKLNAFTDMTIEMPVEWESEAIDDYLAFKYYDDELYDVIDDGLEGFFYETHDANMIDEKSPHIDITCWCKDSKCNKTVEKKTYRISCCCAKNCRKIETSTIVEEETNCEGYLSKCTPFDLIEDFDKIDDGTDYIEDDLDISDFEYETYEGFKLSEVGQWFLDTDNKFLLFDRTCNGYTISTYREGDIVRYVRNKNEFKENLFLLMNRTCTGYTVNTIDAYRDSKKPKYNTQKDITRNAFALRITDDGRVGYRYVVQDCDSDEFAIKTIEGYSKNGIIKENSLSVINVRVNGHARTMSLDFYVNGRLVYTTAEMPKFNFRKLDDIDEKQESVPFNISLGGGTQGLCDTILPNYMTDPYRTYDIERLFAGTFIGYFHKFRFYTCKMDFLDVSNNFKYEFNK